MMAALAFIALLAQPAANYDEALVGAFALPPALGSNPHPVKTKAEWPARRAEILGLFEREMYGRGHGRLPNIKYEVTANERATGRKEVTILFTGQADGPRMRLAIKRTACNANPG